MIINENSIIYFSGTGNTYDVAKKIAEGSKLRLISASKLDKEGNIKVNCEIIGFACPIYYGGLPNIMIRVMDKISKIKSKYSFAVVTYGGMPGNPIKIIDNKLMSKGTKLESGFMINMPGNYIAVNSARSSKVQLRCFEKADMKIKYIVNIVNNKRFVKYEKSPYIIDRPFSKYAIEKNKKLLSYDVNFIVDSKCNNCNMCAKICPVQNINIENEVVKWNGRCEQCMACIQHCPKQAIQISNKTQKKIRYTNPNVKYIEVLLNQNK